MKSTFEQLEVGPLLAASGTQFQVSDLDLSLTPKPQPFSSRVIKRILW